MKEFLMFAATCILCTYAQTLTAQTSGQAPTVKPWTKPTYPQSQSEFLDRFKNSGYVLVCGTKEARECFAFTDDCMSEFSTLTTACVADGSVAIPAVLRSPEETKPLHGALVKCVTNKQRESGKAPISMEACMRLDEVRKRGAATKH